MASRKPAIIGGGTMTFRVDFGGTGKGGDWLTVNIDNGAAHNAPDILCDITAQANQLPRHFAPGSISAAACIGTLEHLIPYDLLPTLELWRSLMQPNAPLLIVVPDTPRILADYMAGLFDMETLAGIIYGPADWQQKAPGEAHHWCFDADSLAKLLCDAGYRDPHLTEWQGDGWRVNGAWVHYIAMEAFA